MQNTSISHAPHTASIDLEQNNNPRAETSQPTKLGAACTALAAAVIMGCGSAVCFAKAFHAFGGQPQCDADQQTHGFPCEANEPSFGFVAGGVLLAFGALASAGGALNLCQGKPFSEGAVGRTWGHHHTHHSSLGGWNVATHGASSSMFGSSGTGGL